MFFWVNITPKILGPSGVTCLHFCFQGKCRLKKSKNKHVKGIKNLGKLY